MKSIKKITNKVTSNVSSLAGSALLVGATLTGGAAFAAAQDSGSSGNSMDLGEYPQPFVSDDGEVQTSIVLGSDAAVADVVGATEIAGSLGNAAFGEEEVAAGGDAEGSWSAANGVTLDTSNTKVHMGDQINVAKNTLTNDDLNLLATQEVLTGDAEQDVEQYIKLGSQPVNYDASPSELDDPATYVNVPAENQVGSSTYLYQLQANFQDGVSFSDSSDNNKNDDVYGQEVMMFGQEYTVSEDSFTGDGQLVLYGSTQSTNIEAGSSTTFTIDDEEITVELVGINNDGEAVLTVDGSNEYLQEDESVDVNGEELRVTKVNNYDPQDSISDNVELSVGSSQVTLEDGEPVMTGSDEDELDGTHVTLKGTGVTSSSADVTSGDTVDLSSVQVSVGAADSDNNYLEADSTFEDPAFGTELHFGGLNPDAMENGEEIEVMTDGDNDAVVDFTTKNDESANINWAHEDDVTDTSGQPSLGDSDGHPYHVVEGSNLAVDDRIVIESGDFSRMIEVTDFDLDTDSFGSNEDEVTVTLEDVVTGSEYEVDLQTSDDGTNQAGVNQASDWTSTDEVIDGQTYTIDVSAVSTGTGGSVDQITIEDQNTGTTDVYNGLETENGATVSLATDVDDVVDDPDGSQGSAGSSGDFSTVQLPTGEIDLDSYNSAGDDNTFSYRKEGGSWTSGSAGSANNIDVGGVQYVITHDSSDGTFDIAVEESQDGGTDELTSPAVLTIEEENDDGSQEAHFVSAAADESDDERIELGNAASGASQGTATFVSTDSEVSNNGLASHDDNDIASDISTYGTYVEEDSGDAGEYSFMYPAGQSTAGLAVTEEDGSVSPSGGAGTVTADRATYQFANGALADDGNIDEVKTGDDVILVGGPAANSLTDELVDDNQTMPADDYTSGQGMIQMVDGFSEGNHALVVAGATPDDTRAAAEFLADYRNNADQLEGRTQVTVDTQTNSVIE